MSLIACDTPSRQARLRRVTTQEAGRRVSATCRRAPSRRTACAASRRRKRIVGVRQPAARPRDERACAASRPRTRIVGFADLRRALETSAPVPRHDVAHGPSGFTNLRRALEAGAARRVHKRGKSTHKAYIVGAAIAVATALAAPVSVALFTGSPGASDQGTERRGVVERKSPPASVATTRPTSPSSTADTEPPHGDPNAIPGTTRGRRSYSAVFRPERYRASSLELAIS